MIKRMLIMLLVVGLVLGGVFGFNAFKGKMIRQYMASQGIPVQTVSTQTASYQSWSPKLKAVGTLRAVQGTEISAEVAGMVEAIHFKQGDKVAAGMALLELNADTDKAKLKAMQATAELAQITYRRDQAQFAAKAISKQTLDIDQANVDIALAQVAEQQALLNKKQLRAPFAGQLGLRNVDVGQYLPAGSAVATLQALDTLYVDFWLPQQALSKLQVGQTVQVNTDAYPQSFTATIAVINPKVDASTRNVQIRASLANPGQKLLPGMFANVEVATGEAQQWLTLPRTAITFNPYGASVYCVEKGELDDKGQAKLIAKQAFVKMGSSRGDQIAILEGIKDGDVVVTSGQIKLRNGSPVIINNAVQPSNDAAPQPVDE